MSLVIYFILVYEADDILSTLFTTGYDCVDGNDAVSAVES